MISAFERQTGTPAEGIDPCHSLVGNLNQFSAAEILQMSCLGQRSGRFTFKSGRGNSEIYLHHGMVRHAVYGTLEGEGAVAEIFRWRQGRFYFEEGIISQVQTVSRPWTHLLIDNLQKLDETLGLRRPSAHIMKDPDARNTISAFSASKWRAGKSFTTSSPTRSTRRSR